MSSSSGGINVYVGSVFATVFAAAAIAVGVGAVPSVTGDSTPTPTPTPTATPTPTGTPSPTVANFYMDTNGGSCARQSTAGAYNDAQACDSFSEVLLAAQAGDVVILESGSSFTAAEGVTTDDSPGTSSDPVEFWAEDYDTVTVEDLDINDEVGLDFHDLKIVKGTPSSNDDKVVDLTRSDYIHFYGSTLDVNWKITDGLGVSGGNDHILWDGGWIKHAVNEKLIEIHPHNAAGQQTDVVIQNAELGDMGYSANTYAGGSEPHGEALWLQTTTGFTLRNVTITGAISTGNMNWGGNGNNLGFLFENVVFGESYGFSGGTDVAPGSATAYRGSATGQSIQGACLNCTGTIQYTIHHGAVNLSSVSAVTYRGNIDQASSCASNVTYLYNRHQGADCSASDVQDSTIFNTGNFVSLGGATGGWDYSPASGSSEQIDSGDPDSYPATDVRGVERPIGAAPDAGAYEGD